MMKSLLVLAPVAVAGCVDPTPVTPLVELTGAHVELATANDSPLIDASAPTPTTVTISVPDQCPRIGDDVTVDLDGVRMTAETRGGTYAEYIDGDGNGCNPISFYLAEPMFTTQSTLLIRDSNTTWTIEGKNLFANDFTLAAPPVAGGVAQIVWHSAQQIDNGVYAEYTQNGSLLFQAWTNGPESPAVSTQGNVIELDIPTTASGAGILSVNASRNAQATRCDGPAVCTMRIATGADLATTIAPPGPRAELPGERR